MRLKIAWGGMQMPGTTGSSRARDRRVREVVPGRGRRGAAGVQDSSLGGWCSLKASRPSSTYGPCWINSRARTYPRSFSVTAMPRHRPDPLTTVKHMPTAGRWARPKALSWSGRPDRPRSQARDRELGSGSVVRRGLPHRRNNAPVTVWALLKEPKSGARQVVGVDALGQIAAITNEPSRNIWTFP